MCSHHQCTVQKGKKKKRKRIVRYALRHICTHMCVHKRLCTHPSANNWYRTIFFRLSSSFTNVHKPHIGPIVIRPHASNHHKYMHKIVRHTHTYIRTQALHTYRWCVRACTYYLTYLVYACVYTHSLTNTTMRVSYHKLIKPYTYTGHPI